MATSTWRWARANLAMVLVCAAWFSTTLAHAQSKVVQIEEHWELAVGEPDAKTSAPQATTVMSPQEDLDGQYFLFTINHSSVPTYEPGGMQVQLWSGDAAVDAESCRAGPLNQSDDTIHWVQRLKVAEGTLTFEVVDGKSSSWGDFGGDNLTFSTPTSLESLNGYRPTISLTESQVGYAGDRVERLHLKKLVWLTDDGKSHELNAPVDADAEFDP